MSNPTLKILPVLMIAITATFVTQPMRASVIDSLVITENSSTSLTAILTTGGVTTTSLNVTPGLADHWTIDLSGVLGQERGQRWFEPEDTAFINEVATSPFAPDKLFVTSDTANFFPFTGLTDGTPDTTTFTLNGLTLSVTFNDKGDATGVPDTGTTASLFGLSLVGLGFLRRKLC